MIRSVNSPRLGRALDMVGEPSISSKQDHSRGILSNTVYIQRINGGELIPVDLADSLNKKIDLDVFKDLCASKLNLIQSSINIYDAYNDNVILSEAQFESTIDQRKQQGKTAMFMCDGIVVNKSTPFASVSSGPDSSDFVPNLKFQAGQSKRLPVTVDHTESKKRVKFRVDAFIAFENFKNKICTNMRLDPATVTIFYMDSDYQVEVLDDESLQDALMETQSFKIDIANKSPALESLSSINGEAVNGHQITSETLSKSQTTFSVTVDDMESKKRVRLRVAPNETLSEFKNKISTKMELPPRTHVTVFYLNSEFRVNVTDDESLQEALEETHSFKVEDTQESNVDTFENASNDGCIVEVTYEGTEYAIEIQSPSLNEFNNELCRQFGFNQDDLAYLQIVHGTTVVTSPGYFANAVKSSRASNGYAKFVLTPKITPPKPSIFSTTQIVPSPPVATDSSAKCSYDVMISYELLMSLGSWTEGKSLAVEIDRKLREKNFKVWFDEREMYGHMCDRMAEAVTQSKESRYCKSELTYAFDLNKPLKPARYMKPNEELPKKWADYITRPLLYYDFCNTLEDPEKFNTVFESLCNDIRRSIQGLEEHDSVVTPLTSAASDPLWLNAKENSLLWLNAGAGLGKSFIAYLISENLPPGFVLGSAIFCKHDDNTKNNPIKIVSTIAFELASKLPEYREFLVGEIENDAKAIANGEISVLDMPSTAFERLIINGLQQIGEPLFNVVIIIDALDEIGKQGDLRRDFLNLTREKMKDLPNWVRVFTTSRPEMDIFQALNGVNASVLLPQDQENLEDIEVFVQHHFLTRLSVDENLDETKLNQLVKNVANETGGVFQYARLACNWLTDQSFKSWDEVLHIASEFDGGLDHIYSQVLSEAFESDDRDVMERYRKVMGVVVTAKEPLHQDCIARLVGLTVAEVGGIILRSLLYWIEALVLLRHLTEDITYQITRVIQWSSEYYDKEKNITMKAFCRDSLHDVVMWWWSFDKLLLRNPLNVYSIVTVNHVDSRRKIWLIDVNKWTFNEFKIKVSSEFHVDAETLLVLSKNNGNYSEVKNEQSFKEALKVTRCFSLLSIFSNVTAGIGKSEVSPSEPRKYEFDVMLSYS
ncbi:hypothetical protein HDU76_000425 [Blyttiomyces sp. JEL0837]|nr:hypothetical protein HDU76_000425 [Blyttiomyces sp. JEL0837]